MLKLNPVYSSSCPVCGGDAYSEELETTGVCKLCSRREGLEGSLEAFLNSELEDFNAFFEKAVGSPMWGGQRAWAMRLLSGENTAIIAPTGLGKTTLLAVFAVYSSAVYRKKALFLVPTRALVSQVYKKLVEISEKSKTELRVVAYDSKMSKKARESLIRDIASGSFDILVATNSFFSRYEGALRDSRVDIVIVDDVDSLLRSQKNIVRLLRVVGFDEDVVGLVKAKMSLLWKLLVSRALGDDEGYMKLAGELVELEKRINEAYSKVGGRQVVFSSATGRMKGLYSRILRELLRVDISGVTVYGRDVTDSYLPVASCKEIVDIVSRLGRGGIVYVSPRHPLRGFFEKCVEDLKQGAAAGLKVEEASPSSIEKLRRGEVDLIYGSANYYGVSVRGVDAPEAIKYIVFLGTPLFTLKLEDYASSLNGLLRLAILARDKGVDAGSVLQELRAFMLKLSPSELRLVSQVLKGKVSPDSLSDYLKSVVSRLVEIKIRLVEVVREIVAASGVVEAGSLTLTYTENGVLVLIPDLMTYIQATGRASRMLKGRMTHGLSVIFEHAQLVNVVRGLEARLKSISNDALSIKRLDQLDLERELQLIESSRRGGGGEFGFKSILVVVESPTKAKTIASFFGRPLKRVVGRTPVYEIPFIKDGSVTHLVIMATRGHLYDLTTNPERGLYGIVFNGDAISPVYETIKKCLICGAQFTYGDSCPRCGSRVYSDASETIASLRKVAREVDEVYIATDPDEEGEKIAYDVYLSIRYLGKKVYRIEMHEITPREFFRALENKRSIEKRLVEAEIYRRALDRLVGFSLSTHLWEKYNARFLGAGRVQTPVLGFIIQRMREYNESKCWKVSLQLDLQGGLWVNACLDDREVAERVASARTATLVRKSSTIQVFNPPPPFTTDDYLAAASRIGITAGVAMRVAQDLFEMGLITYHRTDSTHVSSTGISLALKYLESKNMSHLANPSSWGSSGAHEAIRPTRPLDVDMLEKSISEGVIVLTRPITRLHLRVYDLIFRRFIASQMKPFKAVVSEYAVIVDGFPLSELRLVEEVVEEGFNLVQPPRLVKVGVDVATVGVASTSVVRGSRVALYSEGDVVSLMKKTGIGRPSTYAKIIESIKRHGYVVETKKKKKLVPTKLGVEVYEYLSSEYPSLVSVDMTRRMERTIDDIVKGATSAPLEISRVIDELERHNLIRRPLKTAYEAATIA
jgi:reverse gyrase